MKNIELPLEGATLILEDQREVVGISLRASKDLVVQEANSQEEEMVKEIKTEDKIMARITLAASPRATTIGTGLVVKQISSENTKNLKGLKTLKV